RIARGILHRGSWEPMTRERYAEALSVAAAAHREGRAGSLPAVAAYQLHQAGLLGDESALTGPDGGFLGRNFTGRPVDPRLDQVGRQGPGGLSWTRPPWRGRPYLVDAEFGAEPGTVVVRGIAVTYAALAELVAHDPRRQAGARVVLLLPEAAAGTRLLPRVVADRLGGRSWSSYGGFRWEPVGDGTPRRRLVLAAVHPGSTPVGAWVPSDPGQLLDGPREVGALDGSTFPDSDVDMFPLTTPDAQRLTGVALLSPGDMAEREEQLRNVSRIQHYVVHTPVGSARPRSGAVLRLPRGLTDAFVVVGHAYNGVATIHRAGTGQDHKVWSDELARFLQRQMATMSVPADWPIWAVGCCLGRLPLGADRLAYVPGAQNLANRHGRTALATDAELDTFGNLDPPMLVRIDNPDNPVFRWREFRPEPFSATLSAWADEAGLPRDAPDRAKRVLRWVRAMRQVHGVDNDNNPALGREFLRLLRGFGALERQALARGMGPLTWAELERVAAGYAARMGWDPTLSPDLLARLLEAYRAAEQAGQRANAAPPAQGSAATGPQGLPLPGAAGRGLPRAVVHGGVSAGPVGEFGSRLLGMEAEDRSRALSSLPPDERQRVMADPVLVDALRRGLPAAEFAEAAARLMVVVEPGMDRPETVEDLARKRIARMLVNPGTAAALLKSDVHIVAVPKDVAMTALDPFRHLAGRPVGPNDRRVWDTVRGVRTKRDVAAPEENLVGEATSVPGSDVYADGYSSVDHEIAHAIHFYALDDFDRRVIREAYRAKLNPPPGVDPLDVEWPDGIRRDLYGNPADNYSSTDEFEYFAQAANAYLGVNAGRDPYTRRPRNNGTAWAREHEPMLLPILERLFGRDPQDPGPANPVEYTREERLWEGFRGFWDHVEGVYRPQPHAPAPLAPVALPAPDPGTGNGDPDMSGDTDSEGGVPLAAPPAPGQDIEGLWSLHQFFGPGAIGHHPIDTLMDTTRALRRLALAGAGRPGSSPDPLGDLHGLARRVLDLGPDGEVRVDHLRRLGSLALAVPPDLLTSEAALTVLPSGLPPAPTPDVESTAGIDDEHWVELLFGPEIRDAREPGTLRDTARALRRLALAGAEGPVQLQDAVGRIHGLAGRVLGLGSDGEVTAGHLHRLGSLALVAGPDRLGSEADLASFQADLDALDSDRDSDDSASHYSDSDDGGSDDGGRNSEADIDDLLDLYGSDSDTEDPASPDDSAPRAWADARRPRPLTTRDYTVVDGRGDGVLFRRPGDTRDDRRSPRAFDGRADAPEFTMPVQDYAEILATDRPALRISADRTLAVEDGAQGQQVFATAEAVARSSAQLTRVGSRVRLETDEDLSVILPTPDGGSRRLFRVTPVISRAGGEEAEEGSLEFADQVSGGNRTSHLVLRDRASGEVTTAPVTASDSMETTGTHHLAEALARVADGETPPGAVSPEWATDVLRRDDRAKGRFDGPLPGRSYGSALSLADPGDPRPGALSEAARRIGVNEHAWADVGEGYVVQSIGAPGADGHHLEHNYAKPGEQADRAYLNYHFLTVVLASEDGTHQISLENQSLTSARANRRRGAVRANLDSLGPDELRQTAAELRREIERQQDTGGDEHLAELRDYEKLTKALIKVREAEEAVRAAPEGSEERAGAERALELATRVAVFGLGEVGPVIPGKRHWYLRMYGRRPGESVHDVYADLLGDAPSKVANPLTAVALRGHHTAPASITFPERAVEVPEHGRKGIENLARVAALTAVWNVDHQLRLPIFKVIVEGGERGHDGAGKARARAVAALYRTHLDTELERLQDGSAGPRITAGNFTVEYYSGPSTVGTGRDTLSFTFDDRRGGPRHLATRAPALLRDGLHHIRPYDQGSGGLDRPSEADEQRMRDVFPVDGNGAYQRFPNPRGAHFERAEPVRRLNRWLPTNSLFTDAGGAPWVRRLNGRGIGNPARQLNCLDVARSALMSWFGRPTVAAPVQAAGPGRRLEVERDSMGRTARWLNTGWRVHEERPGASARTATVNAVRTIEWRLGLGRDDADWHGSAAIVRFQGPSGKVHAVNAFNHEGRIYWVDGMYGRVSGRFLYEGHTFLSIEFGPDGRRPVHPVPLAESGHLTLVDTPRGPERLPLPGTLTAPSSPAATPEVTSPPTASSTPPPTSAPRTVTEDAGPSSARPPRLPHLFLDTHSPQKSSVEGDWPALGRRSATMPAPAHAARNTLTLPAAPGPSHAKASRDTGWRNPLRRAGTFGFFGGPDTAAGSSPVDPADPASPRGPSGDEIREPSRSSSPRPGRTLAHVLQPTPPFPGAEIDNELTDRRPPRVDRDLLPPPVVQRASNFADDSRMPAYVDGLLPFSTDGTPEGAEAALFAFGQGHPYLRGPGTAARAIADLLHGEDEETRPAEPADSPAPRNPARSSDIDVGVQHRLERAMREQPRTFAGDGREFIYRAESGRLRTLRVRIRNYGDWERFADSTGPTKIDNQYRAKTTVGGSKSLSTTRQVGPAVPIGPLPGGFAAFGRLGTRLARSRDTAYTLQDEVTSQGESKGDDHSHVHIDDVYYEVHVTDTQAPRPARKGVLGTRWRARPERTSAPDLDSGVPLRDGLGLRLADSLTAPYDAVRIPRRMRLTAESDYRHVTTEDFGPVHEILDWAADRVGAEPGSTARDELAAFFSSGNFHQMADRLSRSMVPGKPLFADDKKHTPLGAFVIERVEPGEAVLASESDKAKLAQTGQLTVQNTRKHTRTHALEFFGVLGPTFNTSDLTLGLLDGFFEKIRLRFQFGPGGRLGHTRGRYATVGGSGAVKSTGKSATRTALYRVEKTVYVRRTGDAEPTAFRTWSLDRMTHREARRLAGLDDGTTLAKRGGKDTEPYAPAYLTEDDPPTLGMSRVVQFLYADGRYLGTPEQGDSPAGTRLATATRQVVEALAREYPGMIAPIEDFGDPADSRWRNHAHYQMALHNLLTVYNALSHHASAGNLETMRTTGLRVPLQDPGRFTRGHRYIWLGARMTGRTFEGTTDNLLSYSTPGVINADGGRYGTQATEATFEALFSSMDRGATDRYGAPAHSVTGQLGYRGNWQQRAETPYGSTASAEPSADTAEPAHLYSYDLAITVSTGGYWRFRSLLRGITSLGLLGTQLFVFRTPRAGLTDDEGNPLPALRAKVLLAVPAEHSPDTDPHAEGADNPYRGPGRITQGRLSDLETRALVDRTPTTPVQPHDPGPLDGRPHQTVSVLAPPHGEGIVDDVLDEAAQGQWHLTYEGVPAHEAVVRAHQPQFLTANFDQTATQVGLRATGLFSKGPYLDWLATVVHRIRVTELRALGRPEPVKSSVTVGASTAMTGTQTRSATHAVGGSVVYGQSQSAGPGVSGGYGGFWRPWVRVGSETETVTRTVTTDTSWSTSDHQVLTSGDAEHRVAADVRSIGLLKPAGRLLMPQKGRHRAGRWQRIKGGWLGHIPERTAAEMRLIPGDDLGTGPLYTNRTWSLPGWLRRHPFGQYPVNSLNVTEALTAFDQKLDGLGRDLDGISREAVRRLVSGRVARALRQEMTGTGSSLPARTTPDWKSLRVGKRDVRVRARLIPVQDGQDFDRLWPGSEVGESRTAVETRTRAFEQGRGSDAGTTVTEAVRTGAPDVPAAGPSLTETGSNRQVLSGSSGITLTRPRKTTTKGPHAQFTTRYRLQLTLEIGRMRGDTPRDPATSRISHEQDVGTLKDIIPLSLLRPDPADGGQPGAETDPLRPPEPADEPPAVNVLTSATDRIPSDQLWDRVRAWRSEGQPGEAPFEMPPSGFDVRTVIGAEGVEAAGLLALAKAYDNRLAHVSGQLTGDALAAALRRARLTPLTAEGTGAAQVLEDSSGTTALSTFAEDATGDSGYHTAGLTENTILDSATGHLARYMRPDLGGAQLLAVADGGDMEAAQQHTQNNTANTNYGGVTDTAIGGFPLIKTQPLGTVNMGVSATGANALDSDGQAVTNEQVHQTKVKPTTGRMFAFAIPTAWLSVAEVDRQLKDSAPGAWIREHLMGPFGGIKPGIQAVETQTQVIAWVREDVARHLGLITDENFPEQLAEAWKKVNEAAEALTEADGEYWSLRRDIPDLRRAVDVAVAQRARARRRHYAA
ncbi:MAG: lonely Cys domain-containing protein, partial [Streptomyces sp.]|nr:lonely Cys domain-containing protein [Streptomyces sp.]